MKKENEKKAKVENVENVEKVKNKGNILNKIISISLLVIISFISISIMVLTFIPKNFDIGLEDPYYIRLYTNDKNNSKYNTTYYKSENSEIYNKVMELYKDSFKTTIFGAFFQGKANEGVTIGEGYKSLASSQISGKTYIEFRYNVAQTLKLNGKDYKPKIVSTSDYWSVLIEVNDSINLKEFNAYIRYKDSTNEYSYVRYVSYAAQVDLYNYINNL